MWLAYFILVGKHLEVDENRINIVCVVLAFWNWQNISINGNFQEFLLLWSIPDGKNTTNRPEVQPHLLEFSFVTSLIRSDMCRPFPAGKNTIKINSKYTPIVQLQ